MTTLRLRDEALADLTNIGDYGASNHGWPAAEAYLASLDGALEQLKRYPLSGMARPELADDLRSITFSTRFQTAIFRSSAFCINRWMPNGG